MLVYNKDPFRFNKAVVTIQKPPIMQAVKGLLNTT
jgi:hypothetical protein